MEKSAALVKARDEEVRFDRHAAGAELAHLLKTPGYTTDKSQLKERALEEFKMETKKPEEKDPLAEALQDELEAINAKLATTSETFMLASPETLTIKKVNGTYSKKAHIGSEDFRPVSVYMGKRGKLIFVFKPVMVADYAEAELDEIQAKEKLMGFKDWCKENLAEIQASIADMRAETALEHERAAMAEKAEQYKDIGFGSW